MIYPHHDEISKISRACRPRYILVEYISVARVRPRTSKGITDLLLPQTSVALNRHSPSKKLAVKDSST